MLEGVGIVRKVGERMKDDEELERLLGEIPHATSNNHHHHQHRRNDSGGNHRGVHGGGVNGGHRRGSFVSSEPIHGVYGFMYDDDPSSNYKYTCASPVSGFSLQSDGSSSSLFSYGRSLSDNGSPTPPSLEDLKSHTPCASSHYPSGLWLDSKSPGSPIGKTANDSYSDELSLSRTLSRMYISNDQQDSSDLRDNAFWLADSAKAGTGTNQMNAEIYRSSHNFRKDYSADYLGHQYPVPTSPVSFGGEISSALLGLQQEYRSSNLFGSGLSSHRSDLFSRINYCNSSMSSRLQKPIEQSSNYNQRGIPVSNVSPSINRLSVSDALFYAQRKRMNLNEERGVLNLPNFSELNHPRPCLNMENSLKCSLPISGGRGRAPSNIRISQGGLQGFSSEDSFIIQGEGLNYVINRGYDGSKGNNKGSSAETGVGKSKEKTAQLDGLSQFSGVCENGRDSRLHCPFSLPPKYNSLVEAQGHIYLMAKDQHGCRFLQRLFDEGTPQDVQIIFNEIIDHVVELMMNPFGNYLMQKLLDVCSEDQRMQIIVMLTEESGELGRISLNTHG